MDRRVPIGMSLRGCGTMTVRPAAFRYFAWLPRLETKEKPSAERMLMKAEEERRFAIGRSGDGKLSDGNLSNTGCHFIGIFQEELDGFLEVR